MLVPSNDDGRKQIIRTNVGSVRAASTRTLGNIKKVIKGDSVAAITAAIPVYVLRQTRAKQSLARPTRQRVRWRSDFYETC